MPITNTFQATFTLSFKTFLGPTFSLFNKTAERQTIVIHCSTFSMVNYIWALWNHKYLSIAVDYKKMDFSSHIVFKNLCFVKHPALEEHVFHIDYTVTWRSSSRGRFTSLWSPKRVSALQRNEVTVLSQRYGHLELPRTAGYNNKLSWLDGEHLSVPENHS